MSIPKALFGLVCAGWLAGCSSGQPAEHIDIAKVFAVKSTFGPQFHVVTAGPSGIDPRKLSPQTLPKGTTFEPADCAKYAAGQTLPSGMKGNMAGVSAEGEGNRFIAIAVETSETVQLDSAVTKKCKHVTFT